MRTRTSSTRIVITGLGVVSPVGIGQQEFWEQLVQGQSGISTLNSFPTEELPIHLAAEVKNFQPADFIRDRKFLKVMSRDIQLGVSAANLSMKDAGIARGDIEPERLGVCFGAGRMSTTPQELCEVVRECQEQESLNLEGWGALSSSNISPLWLLRQLPNMPACHISIEYDARGPNNTITSRDSSALLALAEACHAIQRGTADCMIVGACGSSIHPVDITKMGLFEHLSQQDDPEKACRPFDKDRDGTIVGEGSAAFVLECYSSAVKRGAHIYAEILGVGSGCDGKGASNRANGTGLVRAIEHAITRASLLPSQIGHINAHGKSTRSDDCVESKAFHRTFGSDILHTPVTALKSYFGYADAGSGALELAGSLLALKHGELPATLNYETPDPDCRLNVIHDGTYRLKNTTALTVNRTSVGQSAAAVFRTV